MRVLAISADRSKRGVLYPGTPAFKRQEAYAQAFGSLDVIVFSRMSDGANEYVDNHLHIIPTGSTSRWRYTLDALRLAQKFPTPDVVTVQDPFETGFTGWLIARRVGAPLHVQVHTDFLSPEYARLSFGNRIRVWVAGFVLRRAARVRVVSQRIKDSIEKRYRPTVPVTIVPILADIEHITMARSYLAIENRFASFKTKLLVVARLEPEKNVALSIKAFATSTPKDACLIIVGTGSEVTSLRRLAKLLNVADQVFFEDAQDTGAFYKLADLVLVPSRYEGYGLVIVEALASGKPVLSTDVGIAREAGAIVTTEEKFADALADWFKNGPRTGELKNYPYKNFDEYVRAYCDDLAACVRS